MTPSQIIDVTTLYPILPHRKTRYRKLSQIAVLMVHHSGSKNLDLKNLYDLHTKHLHKWSTIGYHFYVTKSATIYQVNKLTTIVNGCKNHNTNTVHVCFEGDYENEITPYYAEKVIREILFLLQSINVKVYVTVHADHRKTLCCGKNLISLVKEKFTTLKEKQSTIWPELEN